MNTKLPMILLPILLLAASCDQQTKQAQDIARCVMNDSRLSTIVKDPPKAKQWVQAQITTWKGVKARVAANTPPFVTDEDVKVLIDESDVLDRLATCLDTRSPK